MILELADFVFIYSPGPYDKFKIIGSDIERSAKEHNKWVATLKPQKPAI